MISSHDGTAERRPRAFFLPARERAGASSAVPPRPTLVWWRRGRFRLGWLNRRGGLNRRGFYWRLDVERGRVRLLEDERALGEPAGIVRNHRKRYRTRRAAVRAAGRGAPGGGASGTRPGGATSPGARAPQAARRQPGAPRPPGRSARNRPPTGTGTARRAAAERGGTPDRAGAAHAASRHRAQPRGQRRHRRLARHGRRQRRQLGVGQRQPGGVVVLWQHVTAAGIEHPFRDVQPSRGREGERDLPVPVAALACVPLPVVRVGARGLQPGRHDVRKPVARP